MKGRGYLSSSCDWVWEGLREVNAFACPICFKETLTIDKVPKYCCECGFRFSNGGIELEK